MADLGHTVHLLLQTTPPLSLGAAWLDSGLDCYLVSLTHPPRTYEQSPTVCEVLPQVLGTQWTARQGQPGSSIPAELGEEREVTKQEDMCLRVVTRAGDTDERQMRFQPAG